MSILSAKRLFTAALVVAGLTLLGSACSSDLKTITIDDIKKTNLVDDNAAFSALVADNYDQAQVNTNVASVLVDTDAVALNTKIVGDSNAALDRLYGSHDINPASGAPAAGGLASSAGLSLVSNKLTDDANANAQGDVGSVADDVSYADTEIARLTALSAFGQSLLDASADPDGGIAITNEALRTEIQTEVTTWNDELNQATQLCVKLTPDGSDTSCPTAAGT